MPQLDAQFPLTCAVLAQIENRQKPFDLLPRSIRGLHERVLTSLPESVGGVCLPLIEARDLTATSGGSGMVGVEVPTILGALRKGSVVNRLGATLMPGLRHGIEIPAFASGVSASWLPETGGDPSANDELSGPAVSPKRVSAEILVSRQLLVQSPQFEARLLNEIGRAIGEAIDVAAVAGDGQGNNPRGILSTANVGLLSGATDGRVPTYDDLTELERMILDAGVGEDRITFLTSPKGKKRLRRTFENGTGSAPVWRGNSVLGHPGASSGAVPDDLEKGSGEDLTAIIAGDFSNLFVPMWGDGFSVIANPLSFAGTGLVVVTVLAWIDVAIAQPKAFSVFKDVALT